MQFVEYLSMFTFEFILNYNEESDISYTLMVDGDYPVYCISCISCIMYPVYPVSLQPLHRDLPFLPEKRVIYGVMKLVCTLYDFEK